MIVVGCCVVFFVVVCVCVVCVCVFLLMMRRPPRSTLDRSAAASDVYKRQSMYLVGGVFGVSEYAA